MKEGRLNSLLQKRLPGMAAALMKLWFGTCRVKISGVDNFLQVGEEDEKPVIATFWHYSTIFILYQQRHYRATALVSASDDGNLLAGLAEKLNYETARGSSHKKGVQALKGLLKAVQEGKSCALVADGSQGPPLIAQAGALLLASRSGFPIVPIAWSASRYFTLSTWDRLTLPLPFSKIEFMYGKPIHVPKNLSKDELETWRLELEKGLLSVYHSAWQKFGKDGH